MGVLSACVSVHCMPVDPKEMRRGLQMPWDWSYRGLYGASWILGIETRFCEEQPVLLAAEPSL